MPIVLPVDPAQDLPAPIRIDGLDRLRLATQVHVATNTVDPRRPVENMDAAEHLSAVWGNEQVIAARHPSAGIGEERDLASTLEPRLDAPIVEPDRDLDDGVLDLATYRKEVHVRLDPGSRLDQFPGVRRKDVDGLAEGASLQSTAASVAAHER